jgi:nitrite reductase/ring-hydroxylating ferredoxin subunit
VSDIDRWFPVARSEEVISRHVVQAQLLGQEIAVWRDDAGSINAWENRCPHRGVRLSIGFNTGIELRCQYHGWRFATGSGQCTFIPAHPNQKPASAIRATTYGCVERYGFVWVSLGRQTATPALPALATLQATTLRSAVVQAPASTVAQSLLLGYRFSADPMNTPGSMGDASVVAHDAFILTATAESKGQPAAVTFLLAPMSESQTMIHGFLHPQAASAERLTVLRHHNARLTAFRDAVERASPDGSIIEAVT